MVLSNIMHNARYKINRQRRQVEAPARLKKKTQFFMNKMHTCFGAAIIDKLITTALCALNNGHHHTAFIKISPPHPTAEIFLYFW